MSFQPRATFFQHFLGSIDAHEASAAKSGRRVQASIHLTLTDETENYRERKKIIEIKSRRETNEFFVALCFRDFHGLVGTNDEL
jgi:hypothetical protein